MLSAIIVTVTVVTAQQQEIVDKAWTNGDTEYHVLRKGNVLIFQGFDRHEGGLGFILNKEKNGTMAISEIPEEEISYYCPEQYLDCTVDHKVLSGQEVLLIRNNKGALVDIFVNNNMIDMLTPSVILYLAGSYSGTDGKVYVFSADAPHVSGFCNDEQYTVETLYYLPGFIISIGDDKPYLVTGDSRSNVNGIKLRFQPCEKNEDDLWEPQETGFLEMTKINWSSVVDKNIPGRYPFTSTRLMTHGELMLFTSDELDIMRNEIFARHGHIFKTTRYRDHFDDSPWYKATVNDATNLLSEIEQLNVEQIVTVQQIIKNAN